MKVNANVWTRKLPVLIRRGCVSETSLRVHLHQIVTEIIILLISSHFQCKMWTKTSIADVSLKSWDFSSVGQGTVIGFRNELETPQMAAKILESWMIVRSSGRALFLEVRCTLKLSSYLSLRFTRGFFPFHLPTKILYALLACRMNSTCPVSLIALD